MRHCFPPAIMILMALLLATPIVAQDPLINEIRIDQSGGDDDEYFELIGVPGTSLDGFTYLVIGDGTGGSGTIEAVVDLTGEVIPPSGFFVAAEGTFTLATADLTTSLNFENSDNVTHLLVQGFSGANGDDLDTDDNGTLDSMPWTMEVDRIALVEEDNPPSSTEFHYGPPSVGPDGTFVPGHSYACPQGWFIGSFDPLGDTDTPGADNPCPVVVEISEIRIDQSGGDDDEYFELVGMPGDSLDGLTYLVIGDGVGSGTIESVTDLTGQVIPMSGFFVAAEATFTAGTADFTTSLNFENSDNVTHVVVRDFSGANGDDLDTDDDGTLDVTPWSEIVDLIALIEEDNPPASTEFHYGPPTVGPDGGFVPGHAFDCPDGWLPGVFDPVGTTDTPGAPNPCPVNVLISEIRIDQPGGDDDEYFELEGNPGDMLDGLTYLVLGDGTGSGTIESVTDLTGETIPMSGFFVAAEATFSLGTADFTTSLNFENSDNVTHLVVRDFTGANGDDLDTDDDGTLDVTPWSEIVDLIALIEEDNPPASTEFHYGPPTVGPDGSFVPGHPSLCPEGWTVTAFDPIDGEDTPGAPNFCPPPPMIIELVINEVDYDQSGGDTAEFIELLNTGATPINLSGFELLLVNGGDMSTYATIALPDVDLAAGDYFVVCANPFLTPNCDLDVMPDTDLIQNGAPDAIALVDAMGVVEGGAATIDVVSYEGDVAGFVEGSGVGLEDDPAVDNSGISRFPDGTDTDMNNVDLSPRCVTPGEANTMDTAGCASPVTALEIFDIQGSGELSAFDGMVVTTLDNIVTAVGPDRFYMQTPDARDDADPATSNGIVVFTGGAPTVAVGDQVDVVGEIDEFFDLTEFTNSPTVMIDSSSNPLPTAVDFDDMTPSTTPAIPHPLERFEGMRVRVLDGVIVAPTNQFGDAAMVASSLVPRPRREAGIEFPGMMGLPVWDGNPEVFEFDPDGLGGMDDVYVSPTPIAAEGVLNFTFGDYQLELTAAPVLGPLPILPRAVRARNPGEMTIGTLNFLRLFQNQPSMAEYDDRLDKFSRQIREVMGAPDVLAVQEVESIGVLNDLAAKIATDDPAVVYSAELIEGNDVGGIDVGYLVRDTVMVNNVTQIGAATIFPFDGTLLNDRPPLVLEGSYLGAGGMEGLTFDFTTVVVHQRSLGGIDDPVDGDRVRQKRHEQAVFLSQWIGDRQTMNPSERLIVLGDFNAYEFTDGYVDVMGQVIGAPADASQALIPGTDLVDPNLTNQTVNLAGNDRYSFIFDNNAQMLDHIVTSVAANAAVVEIQHGLSNADAADDFETMAGTALRSSDHDGLVLYLDTVGSLPLTLTITPSVPLEGGLGAEGEPSCPGFFDFRITGAQPLGSVVLLASPNSGSELVPAGSCAGTPTGLGRMDVLRRAEADVNGEVVFLDRFLNGPRCGLVFQAMELGRAPCETSNTATPDGGGGPKE